MIDTMIDTMIDVADLDALAAGSLVLAPGTHPSAFRAMVGWTAAVLAEHGPVDLVAATDLPPHAQVAAVSIVGSPAALAELLPAGDEPERSIRALERRLGRPVEALVPLNAAGENALLAALAAAMLGVPLVDGDGCGRVFPLLEQTTFLLAGVPLTPLAVATPLGHTLLLDSPGSRVEDLVRPLVLGAGGWSIAVCYPMDARALAASCVPHTVTRLLEAGRAGGTASAWSPRPLCRGRVVALEDFGTARRELPSRPTSLVIDESGPPHRLFRLEAHNEILLVLADGAAVAAAPDQIVMVSTADKRVLDVERATPGLEVEVMVVPAHPAWHTPQGRRLAGAGAEEP